MLVDTIRLAATKEHRSEYRESVESRLRVGDSEHDFNFQVFNFNGQRQRCNSGNFELIPLVNRLMTGQL